MIRHVARWQRHQLEDRSVRVTVELTPGGEVRAVERPIVDHLHAHLGKVPVSIG